MFPFRAVGPQPPLSPSLSMRAAWNYEQVFIRMPEHAIHQPHSGGYVISKFSGTFRLFISAEVFANLLNIWNISVIHYTRKQKSSLDNHRLPTGKPHQNTVCNGTHNTDVTQSQGRTVVNNVNWWFWLYKKNLHVLVWQSCEGNL